MLDFVSRSVPEYCERIENSFLSEPLNLVSNLAFFVSAIFVYRLYKSRKVTKFSYWFLFLLLLFIGVGSTLWHSFRNPYTLALDAIPVFILLLSFIYILFRRILNNSFAALILALIFFLFQVGVSYLFPQVLNGSIRHFVNACIFIVLGGLVYKVNPVIRRDIVAAIILYILAITFRSVDNLVCPYFSIGTHFLWHILNATAAYFAIKTLLEIKPFIIK